MNVSQLTTSRTSEFEVRKRAIQRREMGEAYKKTAQFHTKKNPFLEALENLLSGKTEKEFYEAEPLSQEATALAHEQTQSSTKNREQRLDQPEFQRDIHELKVSEKDATAYRAVGESATDPTAYMQRAESENQDVIHGREVIGSAQEETIAVLERVKQAALAPAEPSTQDLRVAASASAQIQQTKAALAKENGEEYLAEPGELEPFVGESTKFEIPERFLQNFDQRDEQKQTVFGKDLENLLQGRQFKKALSKYWSHIEMVKNGYRSFDEPQFSRIA
ncbi:putative metalloprotease CJM1_0395 family protein [Lysinibacillus sp. 54212]|uniref:putative metalloprotease CJM1_0395 family protein n=1 Tax=Lysinibacillus sp. 54212 TaxID=3119829 RepID=UPI002FC78EF0